MNFKTGHVPTALLRHAARDAIQHIDNCQFPLIDTLATTLTLVLPGYRLPVFPCDLSYNGSNVTVHDMHDTSISIGSNPAT